MLRIVLAAVALSAASISLAQEQPAPATALPAEPAAVTAPALVPEPAAEPAAGETLPPEPAPAGVLPAEAVLAPEAPPSSLAPVHVEGADHVGAHDTSADGHAADGHAHGVDGEAHGAEAHGAAGEAHADPHYGPTIFNFVVFVAVLTLLLRKSITAFFRERKADISGSLAAAEAAQHDAQARLADTETRLAGIDTQIAEILARAREQAVAEHALILEQARGEAVRILSQAEAQVGDLESASVRRLKTIAADLAIELARELIEKQIQPKDREELFNRTLTRLQKAAG